MLLALVLLTTIDISTPIWMIVAIHVAQSLGFAMLFPALFSVSLGSLPHELYSHGSAWVGTIQQVAGAIGTALFVTIMSTVQGWQTQAGADPAHALMDGAHIAFYGSAALWLIGIVSLFFIRKPETDGAPLPMGH